MVEFLPSKQATRVRFPSPACVVGCQLSVISCREVRTKHNSKQLATDNWLIAAVAQLVEHLLGKEEVMGSSPISSFG